MCPEPGEEPEVTGWVEVSVGQPGKEGPGQGVAWGLGTGIRELGGVAWGQL